MEVCVLLLACVCMATAFPGDTTIKNQAPSKIPSSTEALGKLNEGLSNHPVLQQLRPSGNQPFLFGLPQPRYFLMPQSQGRETNQIGEIFNPLQLSKLSEMSFINSQLLPFNFGSSNQPSQGQQSAQAQDANANAKDSPNNDAVQSQNEPSQSFIPQPLGAVGGKFMSVLG